MGILNVELERGLGPEWSLAMSRIYHRAAWGMALAAALAAGCASEQRKEAAMAHMGDETPPDFLTGPASAVLAGFDGFSADVVATSPSFPGGPAAAGEVIGRQGPADFPAADDGQGEEGQNRAGGGCFLYGTARRSAGLW